MIDPQGWAHQPVPGDSIAVNGCCLTFADSIEQATAGGHTHWVFDVVPQTAGLTTLGSLQPGHSVNLEHAVTAETMLGGHVVQGHIDGVGTVASRSEDGDDCRLQIIPPADAMECIVERGSIALAGVSLTVAAVGRDSFEVALIPTTRRETNLDSLRCGDAVNIEVDYIARIVTTWLRRYHGSFFGTDGADGRGKTDRRGESQRHRD